MKQAGGHGMRMFGGLLERQLPFKRVKTAIVSFMLPLGACPALPSGASQACPAESLKYETLSVSSMRLYRSQVCDLAGLKYVTLPVSSVHPYGDPSTLGFNKRICSRLTPLTIPESRTP